MGNYEQLKEAIKAVIKTNGKQEITGQVMRDTLLAITSSFGQGALFAGIATPETNPLTPDQNVFYLASQSGVYPNFNGLSVADGEIVVFSLSNGQWTKQILSLGGGGSGAIVNEPDEEDLTTVPESPEKNVIRFKNRIYNEANASGKGYKILRKYWKEVNGVRKNILTQDAINDANTIYEIRYDFDLNGAEIQIKEGCMLNFVGGSLNNGIIIGNNCKITADVVKIFDAIILKGDWNIKEAYPQWYGAKGDNENDDSDYFISLFSNHSDIYIPEGNYIINKSITIKPYSVLRGSYKSKLILNADIDLFLVDRHTKIDNIEIFINVYYSKNIFTVDTGTLDKSGNLYNSPADIYFNNIVIDFNKDKSNNTPKGTCFKFEAYKKEGSINTGFWGIYINNCHAEGRFKYFLRAFAQSPCYITKIVVDNCDLNAGIYGFVMAKDETTLNDSSYHKTVTLSITNTTFEASSITKSFALITNTINCINCLPFDWQFAKDKPYMFANIFLSDKCKIEPIYSRKAKLSEIIGINNFVFSFDYQFYSKLSNLISSITYTSENSINLNVGNQITTFMDGINYTYNRPFGLPPIFSLGGDKKVLITIPKNDDILITASLIVGNNLERDIIVLSAYINPGNSVYYTINKNIKGLKFSYKLDDNNFLLGISSEYSRFNVSVININFSGQNAYYKILNEIKISESDNLEGFTDIKLNELSKRGTYNLKPTEDSDIPIGFAYFCTDKQTTEGKTNGIAIYYKGNNVWVDALGRVVE